MEYQDGICSPDLWSGCHSKVTKMLVLRVQVLEVKEQKGSFVYSWATIHLISGILTVKWCLGWGYWLLHLWMPSVISAHFVLYAQSWECCSPSTDRYENDITIPLLPALKRCPLGFFNQESQCFTSKVIPRVQVNDLSVSESLPRWCAWLARVLAWDSLEPEVKF